MAGFLALVTEQRWRFFEWRPTACRTPTLWTGSARTGAQPVRDGPGPLRHNRPVLIEGFTATSDCDATDLLSFVDRPDHAQYRIGHLAVSEGAPDAALGRRGGGGRRHA